MKINNAPVHSHRTRHFGRYRQITLVLVKYRLGELIRTLGLDKFLPFHWVPPGAPWSKDIYTRSQRTRMALEELGTAFVKVGQILSTRTDVLPSDYIEELAKLQNSLKPLPLEIIEQVIVKELGKPAHDIFTYLDPVPVGVASIGQAHAAGLADGTEVIVKVQKPGVQEQVSEDLEILRHMAESASQNRNLFDQYDPVDMVEEIADTMNGELDYLREGRSAEYFAKFFSNDPRIHIPKVYWQHSTSRVIVLERIKGIGILDLTALDKAGFDRKDLAKRSVAIWARMVFENSVFHADPHPGNLFVEADGRLGLVDFGMTGVLDNDIRNNLVNAVKGILDRDVDLVVDSLLDLGAIAPVASRDSLRKELKHFMSHYPLESQELRSATSLVDLFDIIRRNQIRLPANTFLLLKTMAMAQSLGHGLDHDFDFFEMLEPYVNDIVKDRYRPSRIIRRLPNAAAELATFGVGLPGRIVRIVRAVERGEFQVKTDVSGLERHLEHLERLVNRIIFGIIIAAIILGATVTYLAFRIG